MLLLLLLLLINASIRAIIIVLDCHNLGCQCVLEPLSPYQCLAGSDISFPRFPFWDVRVLFGGGHVQGPCPCWAGRGTHIALCHAYRRNRRHMSSCRDLPVGLAYQQGQRSSVETYRRNTKALVPESTRRQAISVSIPREKKRGNFVRGGHELEKKDAVEERHTQQQRRLQFLWLVHTIQHSDQRCSV